MLHIYTESLQPATGWTDVHSGEPMEMGFEPDKLIYTDCCRQKRPAKDCMVQSYYDGLRQCRLLRGNSHAPHLHRIDAASNRLDRHAQRRADADGL